MDCLYLVCRPRDSRTLYEAQNRRELCLRIQCSACAEETILIFLLYRFQRLKTVIGAASVAVQTQRDPDPVY